MGIIQIVGIALIAGILALILRGTKPELAFVVTVTGGIILLLFTFELFEDGLSFFQTLTERTGIQSSLVKALLKMLGIGYLVQFGADTLTDFGQNSLADKLVLCGKLVILILSFPIFESLLSLINRLVGVIS